MHRFIAAVLLPFVLTPTAAFCGEAEIKAFATTLEQTNKRLFDGIERFVAGEVLNLLGIL